MSLLSKLRRGLSLFLVVVACALFATGCDDIISDPNFHTWCGDQLCSWTLESGRIQKAPTWHPNDYGVELLDDTSPNHLTAISQRTTATPKCLDFSVIADVVAEAQVSVQVDFDADGTIDYESPIAAVGFKEQKTQITAPAEYAAIKFTIAKKGTGRAVLAQLDVHTGTDCTAAPVKLTPQALGTACGSAFEFGPGDGASCQSGICCQGICAECCTTGAGLVPFDAGADAADGDADPDAGPTLVPASTCAAGEECSALPFPGAALLPVVPLQCNPGMLKRAARAECLLDEDCTSGACDGASWTLVNVVEDGGACPSPPATSDDCLVTAVHGGRCR